MKKAETDSKQQIIEGMLLNIFAGVRLKYQKIHRRLVLIEEAAEQFFPTVVYCHVPNIL